MPDGSMNTATDLDDLERTIVTPDDFRESDAGLENTDRTGNIVTAVVSNGNDAMNLLFEAAQREERDVNCARSGASIDQTSPRLTSAPTPPTVKSGTSSLPVLSPE